MNPDKIIMTMAEFLEGAQTTDMFDQTVEEKAERIDAIRLAQWKRDRDWSILSGQVVGAEFLC